MTNKVSVLPLVTSHLDTLRNRRTGSFIWDVVVQYAIPVIGSGVAVWLGYDVKDVGNIVAGVAILTGFLFALVVFIFQLRLQVTADPRIPKASFVPRLLDELFANVNYAVLVGLCAAALTTIAGSIGSDPNRGLGPWWSWAVVAISFHLLLVIFMCLKRTRRAYMEMVK